MPIPTLPTNVATQSRNLNPAVNYEQAAQAQLIGQEMAMAHAKQAQQAALNLEAIRASKAKREQDWATIDIEKKKTKILMDEAEMKGELSSFARKMLEEQMKPVIKQKESVLDAADVLGEQAEHETRNQLESSISTLKAIAQRTAAMQSPTLGAQVGAFGGQPAVMNPNQPVQPVARPSIPMGGAVQVQEEAPRRYGVDLSKAMGGEFGVEETPEYKAYEKAKGKDMSLKINQIEVPEEDLALIRSAYEASRNGQKVDKEEILANLSPDLSELLRQMISYEKLPKNLSLRNAERRTLTNLASMIMRSSGEGGYDENKAERANKYLVALGNGTSKLWQQKLSLNTTAQHLEQLDGYIDALGGGQIKPVNFVINFAKDITGDPSITNYETAREAVNNEMQRLLTGVGVTQEGMKRIEKIVDRNTGYQAKKEQMKALVKLIEGRLTALRNDFKQNTGREEQGEVLQEESKVIFDKYLSGTHGNAPELSNQEDPLGIF